MNRPPKQPRREALREEERPAYDTVVNRFRAWFEAGDAPAEEHFEVGTYFGALLNSPVMCAMASQFGAFFRDVGNSEGSYSHADREFVDQVLAAEYKSNVVQNVHVVDAVKSGVRIEAIEALRARRDADLTEDELLLTKYIRQVIRGKVTDTIYKKMEKRLGTRGLIEYTGFIMWLTWIMRMMETFKTGTLTDEEVDVLIAQARQMSAEKDWHGGGGSWKPEMTAKQTLPISKR